MAASFKAQKIRTSAIIGSGSFVGSRPSILIYSASVADASGDLTDTGVYSKVGRDAFLFVSGTVGGKGTTGVSAFGGDVVISGTIYDGTGTPYSVSGGTPAGSNKQIQFNDAGVFQGDGGLLYDKNTATLTVGNLVVTGSVTTITTSNLVISDPLLYIASGSTSSNTNGGIAIASGSSVAHQALVWGRVDTDTWGSGRQDVNGGSSAALTSMTLAGVRASKFEIGSSSTALSSSTGQDVILYSGGGSYINIVPGSSGLRLGTVTGPVAISGSNVRIGNSSVAFGSEIPPQPGVDSYFFVSGSLGSRGTTTRGTAVFGGDLVVSGAIQGARGLFVSGASGITGSLVIKDDIADTAQLTLSSSAGSFNLDYYSDGNLYLTNTKESGETWLSLTQPDAVGSAAFRLIPKNSGRHLVVFDPSLTGGTAGDPTLSSDTNFFVAGIAGSRGTSTRGTAVFGGDLVVTGALNVVSNLTASNARLSGDLAVNGGDITSTASVLTVGGVSNTVAMGGDLRLDTNIIKASGGAVAITLTSPNVAVAGSLTVNGFSIIGGATSLAVGDTTATVTTAGAATAYTVGGTSASTDATFSFAPTRTGNVTFNLASGGTTAGKTKVINIGSGGTAGTTEVRLGTTGGTSSTYVTGALYVSSSQGAAATFFTGLSGSLTRLSNGTSFLAAGSNITITTGSTGQVTISSAAGGTPGGLDTYVQFNNGGAFDGTSDFTFDLMNGKVTVRNFEVTQDATVTGILTVDGGITTNSTSISVLDGVSSLTLGSAATTLSIGSTSGNTRISGSVEAPQGLSGSLTKLTDGRSYLVAGSNVTITSASNGQVTISSTGGGGSSSAYFTDPSAGFLNTTGSLALAGSQGDSYVSSNAGTDVFFFVSGSAGSKGTAVRGTTLFGGDVLASGSVYITGSASSLLSVANTQLSVDSSNDFYLNNTAAGRLSYFGVKTTEGVSTNFLRVRPNSVPENTLVSFLQGLGGHNTVTPLGQTDTNFFVGGKVGAIGGATRGTAVFAGDLVVSGSTQLLSNSVLKADLLPDSNRTRNLGSDSLRFANVYTGDLHLKNERGDYTLIEEEDCLTIRFNKTGKRYRFMLERAPEFDEDPGR